MVYLEEDELYPFYHMAQSAWDTDNEGCRAVDVDEETLTRWVQTYSEFKTMQHEMGEAFRKAGVR